MILSNYTLEKIGFERLPEGQTIAAKMFGLHIYSVAGIQINDAIVCQSTWTIDGHKISLALGTNLNTLCNRLYDDDLVDDLPSWEEQKRSRPPYLAILVGPTSEYSVQDCHYQKRENTLVTFDSFAAAKSHLRELSEKILPRVLTAITCELSTLPRGADLSKVEYVVFGETNKGERINDIRIDMSGSITVSIRVDGNDLQKRFTLAAKLAKKLKIKAARFFELGLSETDDLKSFLYFFLSIEINTHGDFKEINHPENIERLVKPAKRISKSAKALFELRNEHMKSLRDRFIWCAICKWRDISDDDVRNFETLKKIRDDISHGAIAHPTPDQVKSVRQLAQRVLFQPNREV